jgi:carboxyl-terminal processing protease
VAANPGWDKPFEWDRSGAIFMSADRSFQGFTVIGVTPGAPAAEAGLMPGDVVVAVNGRPAAEFTLPEFRAMMTRDGTRVVLRIKRGEEVKEAAFKPRTLI